MTPLSAAPAGLAGPLADLLQARAAELRDLLHIDTDTASDASAEVTDRKDIAAQESRNVVSDVQADHAAHELEQVLAALQRLRAGHYGQCVACGATIDPRRLLALPATPYCTACQAAQEQSAGAPR